MATPTYGRYLTPAEAKSGQYAGKTVTIPGSGIRFKSVSLEPKANKPTGGGTNTGGTDPNSIINANQQQDFSSAYGDPALRTAIDTASKSFFDNLNAPKPTYNAVEYYKSLIGDKTDTNPDGLGVTALESQLTELNSQEQGINSEAKARRDANIGQPVALGVIGGRQSEIDRQTAEQLDSIALRKNPIVNALNTKYSTVNTLMNLKQTDYQNAVADYDRKLSQNLQTIDLLRGLNQDQITAQDRAKSAASANLSIIYNAIDKGTIDFGKLDAGTKSQITKLEVQAGLPVGFTSKLRSSNPKSDIISTTSRSGPDGNEYADVIMRDQSGKITVQHVLLGKAKKTTGGGGGGGGGTGSDTTGTTTNAGGGTIESDSAGGLSFKDKKGNPITAAQYSVNMGKNIIKVLGSSKNPGDKPIVDDLNDVITKIKKGAVNPGTGKKYTVADAYTYAQSSYDWIFNGITQAKFKQIMGL